MGSVLIDRWLEQREAEIILDEASISVVRERVRALGRGLGLPTAVFERVATVASELGYNQLAHARGGHVAITEIHRAGVAGLEVIAADRGLGIQDPAGALRGGPRKDPSASLGVGLASVLELSDEVDFDVRIGEGTCVRARKFASEVPARRQVGVYGRPFPGELESGDDAVFARDDDALLVALADGLGHGAAAREASSRAVESVLARSDLSLDAIMRDCHETISGTRGAVLCVARLQASPRKLETASVGNVSAHLYGQGRSRRFAGSSMVLGLRGRTIRWTMDQVDVARGDVLVLFSDGLTSAADIEGELDLLREHPVVIAQQMVARFSRPTDDVLVVVVR